MVLQEAADAGDLTVKEMVSHFAGWYPNSRNPMEVIEFVGLEPKKRVRTLSGGQRRRLDVAIGVVGRPRLLFMDEPTTGFDPEARHQFWALIRALEKPTILLNTHYLDEAEALADRVAVIVGGSIVTQGIRRRWAVGPMQRPLFAGRGGEELTDDPVGFIRGTDESLEELTVTWPSLGDVYLQLIGEHR